MIETLWDFQEEGVTRIEAATERRILACAPTGSGKTVIGMELARRTIERGKRINFIVPRRELIYQTCQKLDRWAPCGYGIIAAGQKGQDLYAPIQVCSIDTLVARAIKGRRLEIPSADLVLVDEAHLYQTSLRTQVLDKFPQAKIVGLTATPSRGDGRAMAISFDRLIEISDTRTLTERGFLVPAKYYAPTAPDLERVRITAGDYNQQDAEKSMQPLLGDIIAHWMKHAATRRTVVFASSVGHSVFLADSFRREGVAAEHCDATTDKDERDAIFERFRSGETQMLCNVDLATYGFDLPELDCVVLARPTRSIVRYLQALGRGLRRSPGKEDCLVLDHAGSVHYHGKADEERFWTLDGMKSKVRDNSKKKKAGDRKPPRDLTCPRCKFIFSSALTCPECGYHFEALAKRFHVVDGELVSYAHEEAEKASALEKMRFYCELLGHARNKGWKAGWAAYKYKDRFKVWPPRQWNTYTAIEPSMGTLRYLKYMFIRQAKAKQAAAKQAPTAPPDEEQRRAEARLI